MAVFQPDYRFRRAWDIPPEWLRDKGLAPGGYYLVGGRFGPENNYETMIREFMKSTSPRDFAIITNVNDKFLEQLEARLHFKSDRASSSWARSTTRNC